MRSSGNRLVAKASVDGTEEKLIHVLYVDDEAGLLKAAKPILEMFGPFRVETALSVKQAVQKMKEKPFDVIVSDYQMPKEDGLDFLKRLRKDGNQIPFILFTGKGREAVAIEALNLGADRYFNKIGRPEAVYGELAYGIRSAVRARSAEDELRAFKTIAEKAGYGVLLLDLKGNTLYVNESCAKTHGYTVDELVGKSHSILHKKNEVGCITRATKELLEKGYVVMEAQHIRKDGSVLPVLVNATVIKDAEESPLYISAVITDITERVVTLEKLQRRTADLSLINSINDSINRSDSLQDVITLLSNETSKLFAGSGATVYLLSEDKKFLVMQNLPLSSAEKGNIEKLIGAKIPQIKLPLEPDSLYYQTLQKNEPQIINDPEIIKSLTAEFAKSVRFTKKLNVVLKPLMSQINRVLGIKSVMLAPLVSNGDTIGLVDISSKKAFTESDLERFNTILKPLTVAIKRRQTEEQLKESEEKFRQMIEQAPDLIVTIDEKGIVTSCNSTLESETDYSQPEIVGKHFIETPLLQGVDPAYAQKLFNAIIEGKHADSFELTWFLKDGTPRISEVRIGVMKKEGKIAGFTAVARDITEQKKSEAELEKERQELDRIIDSSPIIIFYKDNAGKFLRVNKAFAEALKLSKEDFLGKTVFDLYSPKIAQSMTEDDKEVLESGRPKLGIIEQYESASGMRWVQTDKIPIFDENSIVTGLVGFAQDITERMDTEAALRESEERYRNLFESTHEGLVISGPKGDIVRTNSAFAAMLGYDSPEELVGIPAVELYVDPEARKTLFKKLLEAGYVKDYELVFKKKDGSPVYVVITALIRRDKEGNILQTEAFIRNITERKKAEEALEKSEEQYRTIVELSPDGIITMNLKGTVTSVNKAFLDLTGFSEDEIVGKHFSKLGTIRVRDIPRYTKLFASFLRGKLPSTYEFAYVRKDGSQCWGDARFSFIKKDGKNAGIQAVLRDMTEHKRMAEQLKESEEKYRTQFEAAMDAVFLADAETGILVDCNLAATKLVGRKKSEIVGKHQRILHPPEEISGEFSRTYKQHLKEKEGQVLEAKVITKNGEIKNVAIKANILELDSKRLIQGTFRDITERKKAEEALRESEEKYKELINGMNDTAWVIDFDCSFIDVNDAAVKALGYSREELLSMKIFDIDFTLKPEEIKALVKGMPKDEIQVFPTAHTTKDGKTIPVEISSSLVTYQGKQAILSIARDITERKRMENALQESEARFRQVAENSGEWIWEVDADGLYTYSNPVVEKILGYKPEELVGKKAFYDLFHPDDREELEKAAFQGFAEKKPFNEFINRVVHKNGKAVWLSTSGVPIVGDEGNLLGYRGSDTDITERKQIEEQLKKSEEKYRKQFEKSLDAKLLAEAETGIIVDCNHAATKLFGRKKSELIGKHQRTLHPPEGLKGRFSIGFKQHLEENGGQALEEKIISKNGEIRDVLINATTFELDGKKFLQGTFYDITDRKKAEAALRESEKRFRELSELLPEVVFETDATGLLTFVNQAAFERFGYSKKDFDKGLNALQMIAPEDRQKAKENIEKVLRGEKVGPNEYMGLKKDGTRFPFIINSTSIFRGNKPAGLRGLIVNITERKKAEEKLEGMMNQVVTINEKLGVVGKLTRHDARNKLSVIANNVYLAKQKIATNHGALEYLGSIESAIDQIEELFDFAKAYEMLGVEELSYIDVKKSFDEAAMLFSGLDHIKLVNECQGLTVMADSLLRKLFYNLVDDTLKHGGKVSQIRVYYEEDKNQLKLAYEDDGVGIPEHEKEKIFEEGYGKGTGYGLYLIKKICEEYGWTIKETGTQKKGAQFTVNIPKMTENGKLGYVIKKS